jgi:hypothetical protein
LTFLSCRRNTAMVVLDKLVGFLLEKLGTIAP